MTFEDQLKALIFFHLEEHTSGSHLVKVLQEDDFARQHIAPEDGIKKSTFFEAINERGLEQLEFLFEKLCVEAAGILPGQYGELGDLVAIDGTLIDAVLSMAWADYRKNSKKAKLHVGFDLNHAIPAKIFLTDGKGADSKVFYDAEVLLGTPYVNQSKKPLRLVGYRVAGVEYWIATDRRDLSAEQIAMAYKLRWENEKFFAWWKRHLHVYHLIARSRYGLMVQILSGLITYLLLAIYCHNEYEEPVSINRVRELRIQIQNELREQGGTPDQYFFKEQLWPYRPYAKT
jgi:hypothetical protein